ncbi:MAG: hypothetical protein JWN30_732 [Bacilli bacterium]|nr:hypothetical protein [Bacilli bacterium]
MSQSQKANSMKVEDAKPWVYYRYPHIDYDRQVADCSGPCTRFQLPN